MQTAKGLFSRREEITKPNASENNELDHPEDIDGRQSRNNARDELRIRRSDLPRSTMLQIVANSDIQFPKE